MNPHKEEPTKEWMLLNKVDESVSKLKALNYLITRALACPRSDLDNFFPVEGELYSIHLLSQQLSNEASVTMEEAFDVFLTRPLLARAEAANGTPGKNAPESNSSRGDAVPAHSRGESPATRLQGGARGKTARDGEGGAA